MNQFWRILSISIIPLLTCFSTGAINIVTYTVSDSLDISHENLEMRYKSISNEDNKVRIIFEVISANAPFTIYKAEWLNGDSTYAPLEPFSLIAQTEEVDCKSTDWTIAIDFPFSESFEESDLLIITTDKGIMKCPTSRAGELKDSLNILHNDFRNQLDLSERSSQNAWRILIYIFALIVVIGCPAVMAVRHRFIMKRKEIEELSLLVAEKTDRNLQLEEKVNTLYGSRLDTLNMLCNEYYEKSESEKVKLTLYNEVEKHIMSLRDSKSVAELEDIVNSCLDNILVRIKDQLPELKRNDLVFLTYLFAGFSPRAICIFTDIKIKNFYNRRSRLKERILASEAPDKEYFVSKM